MNDTKTPLRKLREARGLSQKKVAAEIDIDQAAYSRIEAGEAKPADTVAKIVKFFGSALTEAHVLFPDRYPDYAVLPEHVGN